jgi:hypothetical protein
MAAVIKIKLGDLLNILKDTPKPRAPRPSTPGMENDLDAIKEILESGPARRRDLEFELSMSSDAVLRRLHMLMDKGTLITIPDHRYQKAG